jgi:hypothetical protein
MLLLLLMALLFAALFGKPSSPTALAARPTLHYSC